MMTEELDKMSKIIAEKEEADLAYNKPVSNLEYNGKVYSCTTSVAMNLIGGKWKTVILVHLINSSKRYSELHKLIPIINERTLSIQLKKLEDDGIISRKVFTKKPPLKVVYSLTDFGKTLIPSLLSIAKWGYDLVIKK
ncbi:MAG: winged helix-turn-helix transcriptional regulator [Bacteroidales bacterium]